MLYTQIAQLMAHATKAYIAAYLEIVTKSFDILQRIVKSQKVCISFGHSKN